MIHLLANALVPIFAGLLLGYWAGRRGWMDSSNVRNLIALVMTVAVPSAMFFILIRTTRHILEQQFVVSVVIGLTFGALYLACFLAARRWGKMSIPDGAVLALTIGFPNSAAVALPLLASAFGTEAAVPAVLSIAVGSITLSPVTLALLELGSNPAHPAVTPSALMRGMLRSFAKPAVWSPIVALICVAAEIHLPSYIQGTFETLGNASSGSALLLTGLVISAQPFHPDASVILSTVAKLVGQPLQALGICLLLGLPAADLRAVTLIGAIPGGFLGLVFGKAFNAKAQAASSSLIANYAVSVLSLPLWILILNKWT